MNFSPEILIFQRSLEGVATGSNGDKADRTYEKRGEVPKRPTCSGNLPTFSAEGDEISGW